MPPSANVRGKHLRLDGASNFRDIGGYPVRDGRLTQPGRLFRSDALSDLSGRDVAALRSLGLATVIDLRTPAEVERAGEGPLAGEGLRHVNFSVLPAEGGESRAAPAPAGDDLAERYRWYLDVGRDAIAGVLRVLADAATYPAVVHCTAGKDRTGVVAALVLDCLGASREVIARDYAETAGRMDAILRRLRLDPRYPGIPVAPARLRVDPATMRRFLDLLYRDFGGARGWALSAGVTAAELGMLTALLLGDNTTAAACPAAP